MRKMKLLPLIITVLLFAGCVNTSVLNNIETVAIEELSSYIGNPYIILNNNEPTFTEDEITAESYEAYSNLDYLGRCGVAMACIGEDLMPTEDRGSIGHIKPSGWQTVKYDFVDGKYLYNRCHLIGFQLTGENDNEKNLITGTRYFNVEGMLPFENLVADYIKETGNHVMYRVVPLYEGNDLVARGVTMEGFSVEDDGAGISFNVFCYNVQPGVEINYAAGDSWLCVNEVETTSKDDKNNVISSEYVLNMKSYKFHKPTCGGIDSMSEINKGHYTGNRTDLIEQGYEPCGSCNP